MPNRPKILLIAGEASGDMHAARLVRSIAQLRPEVEFTGIGGDRLAEAGLEILVPASEMNVVGFLEVARRYRFLRSVFSSVVEWARQHRPAFAILVDYPGFNLRLARELKSLGIPVIYYISPQVWAWKEGRVEQLRQFVADLIVVFPFEVEYFRERGIEARYFGHPLVDEIAERRQKSGSSIDGAKPTLAYLPGSRPEELRRHMPAITGVIERLGSGYRHLIPRASTVSREMLGSGISATRFEIVDNAYAALDPSRAALVKSGTSTVETALIGIPFAVIYKTSPITYQIARRAIKVPWLAMVNILAGRQVVREFIQNEIDVTAITEEMRHLLADGDYRRQVEQGIAAVRESLGGPGAPQRTAEYIVGRWL